MIDVFITEFSESVAACLVLDDAAEVVRIGISADGAECYGTTVYVVTEKCTRFSLKSVPLERRIKGNKSLLFLS